MLSVLSSLFRRKAKDPDSAPPAFGPEPAHDYSDVIVDVRTTLDKTTGKVHEILVERLSVCCVKCGGGKNHPVHHGVRFTGQ